MTADWTDALSFDGRTFELRAGLSAEVPLGGYVEITDGTAARRLGQVTGRRVMGEGEARHLAGHGRIVEPTAGGPFSGAKVRPAPHDVVRARVTSAWPGDATVELGWRLGAEDVPALLRARGLARHTFLCGQSGSGKTYTAGVLLEQMLVRTTLRMVVLDPNSDYVHLGQVDPDVPADGSGFTHRLAEAGSDVYVFGAGHRRSLGVVFSRLTRDQQAIILRIDPLQDAAEFGALRSVLHAIGNGDFGLAEFARAASGRPDDGARRLGARIENLGLLEAEIWATDDSVGMLDDVPDSWRALVLDLGSLALARDRSILAASAITTVWERRHEREPLLLVIDEAHNICPSRPADADQALATELLVAIAGEGRKYGIHLLLASQRPQKVHENVLSQCDNLIVMRMNSTSDRDRLADVFSQVPPDLIEQAAGFGMGEGLAAGLIAPDPMAFTTGTRHTPEGGSDVPSGWALVDPRDR